MVDNASSSFWNNSNPTPTTLDNLLSLVNEAIAASNAALASANAAAASAAAAAAMVGTALLKANNLSDVASVSTSRTNLGLGSAALLNTTGVLQPSNNLSDVASAPTSRTNLGLGTAATFASSAFAQTANNLSDLASAPTARTNLGLGTAATFASTAFAQTANNLSDLANAGTARTNLGLGTAATLASSAVLQTANNLSELTATAATARTNLGLGSAATQPSSAFLPATSLVGHLGGLLTNWNSTTLFTVATGTALSDDNSTLMSLGSSISKNTSAWAAGTSAGGLDTGTIAASSWYHIFLIENTTGPVVDVLFSLSATAPTMPSGYSKKRRIGSIKTDASSHFIQYNQDGDYFTWTISPQDVNTTTLGTTTTTFTLASVPTGVTSNALLSFEVTNAVNNGISIADSIGAIATNVINAAGIFGSCAAIVPITNTSAQIKATANNASSTLDVFTLGWIDRRGRG